MKKLKLLSILCLLLGYFTRAQSAGDAAIVAAVSLGHYVENENLKKIRNHEAEISALQTVIAEETYAIKELEKKLYQSMATVQAFINDAQTIREITIAGEQIAEYQTRTAEIVADDPELLIIALRAEAYLVEQSANLLLEISFAVLGGDANLMNNKERMDLLHHILERMTHLRSLTYSLMKRLEMAEGIEVFDEVADILSIEIDVDWEGIDQLRKEAIETFINN
ncbi:hypothetical protein [Maribacter polysaccharolyticus]|uniref:hypothetical protein n=1 Tax=Maribacter polysaccharolyticus TaxID=3020831 RepID=UPI00237F3AF8|nr:hypothetical protein [Maribacter polysaccharolyticus]MDE3744041.1 hypothetical protein [Maribacter polysaccharolyticus]